MIFRSRVPDNVQVLVVCVQVLLQDHNKQDRKLIVLHLEIVRVVLVVPEVVRLIVKEVVAQVAVDLIADQDKVAAVKDSVQVLAAAVQVQVAAEILLAHLVKVAERRVRNVNLKKRYAMILKICKRQQLAAYQFRAEMAKQLFACAAVQRSLISQTKLMRKAHS